MADDNKFSDLKTTLIKAKTADAADASKVDNKRDSKGRAYATGRRKESVARVWIKPGSGKIIINGRDETVYFARPVLRMILRQPLVAANRDGQFDVIVTVNGGGLSGQAGAVRHGISRLRLDQRGLQIGELVVIGHDQAASFFATERLYWVFLGFILATSSGSACWASCG